jgi:RHS repeat-associated protein
MVLKMDALGHFSSLTYDPVGNLTAYTDRNGHTILYEYDEADRMTKKTDPMGYSEIFSYNPAGKVTGYTDKNGLTTVYAYDCCHLISSTSPLGYSEYYSYDPGGNLTSVTDRKGNTMYYAYDCLNRMISRTNALGNSFTYGYDPAGNKTEMNDPNAHQTQYTFDASGRMTSVMTPMGNTTQFTYDGAGNILSKTDPDGNVINYQYDPMHHLTEKSYPDGSSIEYIYDPAGNPVQLTHNGEPYDVTTNTYDAVNRLLTRTVDYSRTFTKTTQYSFDNEGNRTQMNSDGLITAWQYDAGDRLISITNPLNEITTYDYDSGGRRTGLTYPNGVYTTYLYDNENNLSDLAHYKASDELIMGFVYNYDLNGNRISVEERYATGTFTTNYGYNSLNNLMSAETSWGDTSQYTYDNVGNRSSLVKNGITTLYSYDADDRMLSEGMTTYAFDNNGNMVLKTDPAGTTHYSYDAENRLVHVVLLPANDTITYQYAASGERIGKKASPAELFGLNCYFCPVCCNYYCEISEGYDDYGNVQYAFTQGQQHDEHLGLMMGGSSYYYLSDGLGSVRALVDDQADVVQSYEYDPFGVITYAYGSVENPYRFTGREYEDQLAQYYYRARYYDPASGRFTSRDPKPVEDMAGSAGTMDCMPGMCGSSCEMAFSINEPPTAEAEMHPYAYVDNNPVNWVDPSGKVQNEGCSPIGKVEISTVCGPKEGPLYNCQPKNVTKDEYNWEESIEVNLGAEYRGVSIGVTTGHKKGERVETELQPCSATQFCVQVSCVCAYDYAKTVSRRFEELWDRTFHGNPLTLLELPDVYVYSWQCSLTGSHGWEPAPLPCDRPGCKCCEACQAKESNK